MAFERPARVTCSTCLIRPKEDGGKGGCSRTTWYPILKERGLHDCPLWKRQPTPRPAAPETPEQGSLF